VISIVLTPPLSGPANMDLDLTLLELASKGGGPFFRLYAWDGPWISLGYAQVAERVVRSEEGIGIVRRPTGGKALLHDLDLTYSVALPPTHPLACISIRDSYKELSLRLIEALKAVGVEASLGSIAAGSAIRAKIQPCAAEVNIESVLVQGRKLIGSAQVRRRGAILQHGSIPTRPSTPAIVRLLKPPDDGRPDGEFVDWYHTRTTTLADTGTSASRQDLCKALLSRFEEL